MPRPSYDCSTGSTARGEAVTNFKSYTNGYARISSDFDYPATFSERELPWSDCVTFDHERTTERHYVLTSWFPEQIRAADSHATREVFVEEGSDSMSCSQFGPGMITVIILENEYGDGIGNQLGWVNGGLFVLLTPFFAMKLFKKTAIILAVFFVAIPVILLARSQLGEEQWTVTVGDDLLDAYWTYVGVFYPALPVMIGMTAGIHYLRRYLKGRRKAL